MTPPITPRESCRLCDAPLKPLVNFGRTPAANAYRTKDDKSPVQLYPLVVGMCTNCGHAQLMHVVDPKVLFTNYRYASGTSPVFIKHFEELAEELKRCGAKSVLEIGSNDGTFLRALTGLGIQAVGIDPSAELAGTQADGLNNRPVSVKGFFNEETAKEALGNRGPPDFIVANNVLAHVDDLKGVFKLAVRMGVRNILFEVQSEHALLKDGLSDNCYHEHLDYHALSPLMSALPRWGYLVTGVDQVDTHGGSIRVWATNLNLVDRGPHPRLSKLCHLLNEEGTIQEREAKWEALIPGVSEKADALAILCEKFESIALYGAPAKLTTFACCFDLQDYDNILYVVDDSVWKQGLMTPNGKWEIVGASKLVENPPEAVLITAWNFFDSIHKRLRESGFKGKVIRALPRVEVFADWRVVNLVT